MCPSGRSRAAALAGARGVRRHVLAPELDDVAVGVGDVDGAARPELDGAFDLCSRPLDPVLEAVDLHVSDVERIVDVCTTAAAGQPDLLGPEPEPGGLADQVPVPPLGSLAVERLLEPEHVAVEAPRRVEV